MYNSYYIQPRGVLPFVLVGGIMLKAYDGDQIRKNHCTLRR